ncbi:hypothetical protein [Methylophaga thiooxydans]|nr:hypothetical protein [Methylophaga thiooxydans]
MTDTQRLVAGNCIHEQGKYIAVSGTVNDLVKPTHALSTHNAKKPMNTQ